MSVGTLKAMVMQLVKEYYIVDNTRTMNSLARIEYTYEIIAQEKAKLPQFGSGKKAPSIETSFGDQTSIDPGWKTLNCHQMTKVLNAQLN